MVLVLGAKVVQVEHNAKKKEFFLALSKRSLPSPKATVVQVEHNAKKKEFFLALSKRSLPSPKATVVQVEHNAKKKEFFLALSKRSLPSPKATVVQVEHNAKKKRVFSCIVETQPTFATGNSSANLLSSVSSVSFKCTRLIRYPFLIHVPRDTQLPLLDKRGLGGVDANIDFASLANHTPPALRATSPILGEELNIRTLNVPDGKATAPRGLMLTFRG